VSDSSVFKKGRVFYATQAEGLGGKKQMTLSLLKELRVGNYKFKNVPVHIFSDDYNVTNYPQMGGLIGNDIMRRFNMIINYPDQIIHIRPNRYFIEPFDYSYTGLAFYLFKGQVRVEDIMAGSPAEKAGFQPGDIIFSVDKTITRDIRTYRNMFQNSLGRVAVMVIREGKPLVLTLDVQDIRKSRRR
jgi:membrane-associated protease RseP (regulator of RpoE activity)